jgi:alpha-amylase/alpha-mannosidase (GH57 family)
MSDGTSQAWRKPLREALDWLRDELACMFEDRGRSVFSDPWAASDGYIDVILGRKSADVGGELARSFLEMQQFALLMFTSCGWFFDDIGGLEAVQNLRYAARAIELAKAITGVDLALALRERLAAAPSNDESLRDGRGVWDRLVAGVICE